MMDILTAPRTKAEALHAAKDLLLVDGWTQGRFVCSTGQRCASGALRAVTRPTDAIYHWTGNDRPDMESAEWLTYRDATFALATAMKPDWEAEYLQTMTEQGREDGSLAEDDTYTAANDHELLEVAEDAIFTYNDSRVKTEAGRDEVLAKFDEAARS